MGERNEAPRFRSAALEREYDRQRTLESGGKIDILSERLEDGARELAAYRSRALASWCDNGGTVTEFDSSWPELRREYLAGKVYEDEAGRE